MKLLHPRTLFLAAILFAASSAVAAPGEPDPQPGDPIVETDTIPAASQHSDSLLPRFDSIKRVLPTIPAPRMGDDPANRPLQEWERELHYFELMYRGVQLGTGGLAIR